jgi:hypothetical protein
MRYIQSNPDKLIRQLPFDIDRPGGAHDWQLLEAPAPNITVENPENGHAHVLYVLGLPIPKVGESNPPSKAMRFLAAVQEGLRVKLDADPWYSGRTVKNPLCDYWKVDTWQDELYDLAWLSEFINLKVAKRKVKRAELHGFSRNVDLFDCLRHWAYRAVRCEWRGYDEYFQAVRARAGELNEYRPALTVNEVRNTAKSVSTWTWQRFSAAGFSAWQSEVGKRGQVVSAQVRGAKAAQKRQLILDFPGWTSKQVQIVTGIPAGTVRRLRVSLLPLSGEEAGGVHLPISVLSPSSEPPIPPQGGGGHTDQRGETTGSVGETVRGPEGKRGKQKERVGDRFDRLCKRCGSPISMLRVPRGWVAVERVGDLRHYCGPCPKVSAKRIAAVKAMFPHKYGGGA